MAFLSLLSALLAIGFCAEAVGLYAHELNATLAVALLLLGAVFDPATRRGPTAARGGMAGGLALCAVGLLLLPVGPSLRLFAAALWFWGLDGIARGRGHYRAASAALALGCLVAGVFQYAYSSSLLTWYAVQDVTAWLCKLAVGLTGEATDVGPTFMGPVLVVFTLGTCVGGAIVASRRRWPSLIVSVVGIVAVYVAYLCIFSLTPQALQTEKAGTGQWVGLTEFLRQLRGFVSPLLPSIILGLVSAGLLASAAVSLLKRPWHAVLLLLFAAGGTYLAYQNLFVFHPPDLSVVPAATASPAKVNDLTIVNILGRVGDLSRPLSILMILWIIALGTFIAAAVMYSLQRRPWTAVVWIGIGAVYGVLVCMVFAIVQSLLDEASKANLLYQVNGALRKLYPVHLPLLLPLLLAVPLVAYLVRLPRREPEPRSSGDWLPSLALALMVVAVVWALTNVPGVRKPGALNVVFYEKGFHNWMVPTHERYGSRSAGMFGNLPLLVRRMGWRSELVSEVSAEALARADILVVMNQKDPFTVEAMRTIHRFVENGGSLLVLGDHTFAKTATPGLPGQAAGEARFLLNEPIENTNIRFRFDSGYYFIGGWLHSLQYWPHQMTAHLGDASNESGCVVGASLETRYPVVPLIIGRYGYADRGDWKAPERGFMDDGEFNPGAEKLGDLVLAAAQDVGRGRVVVVGDTSGFVNMIQAQTWPFTSRVFHWLGSTGRASVPRWREWLALVLLAAAGWVVLVRSRDGVVALPIACLSLIAAGSASQTVVARTNRPDPFRDRVAVVDLSHVGWHSIEGWRDNGIAGIYLNLMRKGYFAFGSTEFDERQIAEADLFVTIAPTKPYTRGEIDFLADYLRKGGAVLLATGWEEQAGARGLLDRFGLEIPPKPQGRASVLIPGTDVTPQFWRSWPVRGADEKLVEMRGDPVIVRKYVGKGQLVVIGDAAMLMNQNLENEDGANLPNIRFFDWLLDRIAEKEPA